MFLWRNISQSLLKDHSGFNLRFSWHCLDSNPWLCPLWPETLFQMRHKVIYFILSHVELHLHVPRYVHKMTTVTCTWTCTMHNYFHYLNKNVLDLSIHNIFWLKSFHHCSPLNVLHRSGILPLDWHVQVSSCLEYSRNFLYYLMRPYIQILHVKPMY